ncbi:MAG: hypothetical protein LUH05_03015 [Candidatus Gastranaerophilales bacterium]|nr:hypothetical protein [Candidatus Gastranaerophilales bacterium]
MNNTDLINEQIELEKRITQLSIDKFRKELAENQNNNSFSNSKTGSTLLSLILKDYLQAVNQYIEDYKQGKATKTAMAVYIIEKIGAEKAAYISSKVILNLVNTSITVQQLYKSIGQAFEDEFKMDKYRNENKHYYDTIQKDLNSRQAKALRKRYITDSVFNKRLNFHVNKWSNTEKVQTGLILTELFIQTTGLIKFTTLYQKKKQKRTIIATNYLKELTENLNNKLEVLDPFYLPMICKPKPWTGIFEGGYISPYLKRNKVIKNNNKQYLEKLKDSGIDKTLNAINIIQDTAWKINKDVLNTVIALWEEGQAVAGLPKRDDDYIESYPYPEITDSKQLTEEQKQKVVKWKRETYETYKRNVTQRSIRILTSQIIKIAEQFKDYEQIYFPYQMDFRGRLYPIPALLQPQGNDLAKGLLCFGEGKPLNSQKAKDWFYIHGANMYGEDKVSYQERIEWVEKNRKEIINCAKDPICNRQWTKADKPFQYLAWCIEFYNYNNNSDEFISYIPVQLDGTCNGLQHYSALLRDETAGQAVNLTDNEKPSDIYQIVADKLKKKLQDIKVINKNRDTKEYNLATRWLNLGINRKLTKRPVMVLPYGGSRQSSREYIEEYLKEHYSGKCIWESFQIGNNPNDCIFKVSLWLSHYLWEAIENTLKSAIIGMEYIKSLARETLKQQSYLEWYSPMGLLIHQAYQSSKKCEIKTELYGSIKKTNFITDKEGINKQRQLNGICPNYIHSLDASCLMLWLIKCQKAGINSFMSVHDCYGVLAADMEKSSKLLREAFVEIYQRPLLDDFEADLTDGLETIELPNKPKQGNLDILNVLKSKYFFN